MAPVFYNYVEKTNDQNGESFIFRPSFSSSPVKAAPGCSKTEDLICDKKCACGSECYEGCDYGFVDNFSIVLRGLRAGDCSESLDKFYCKYLSWASWVKFSWLLSILAAEKGDSKVLTILPILAAEKDNWKVLNTLLTDSPDGNVDGTRRVQFVHKAPIIFAYYNESTEEANVELDWIGKLWQYFYREGKIGELNSTPDISHIPTSQGRTTTNKQFNEYVKRVVDELDRSMKEVFGNRPNATLSLGFDEAISNVKFLDRLSDRRMLYVNICDALVSKDCSEGAFVNKQWDFACRAESRSNSQQAPTTIFATGYEVHYQDIMDSTKSACLWGQEGYLPKESDNKAIKIEYQCVQLEGYFESDIKIKRIRDLLGEGLPYYISLTRREGKEYLLFEFFDEFDSVNVDGIDKAKNGAVFGAGARPAKLWQFFLIDKTHRSAVQTIRSFWSGD